MKGKTIAILESRLGIQMVELVEKRGARAFHAPALAEIPDIDPRFIASMVRECQASPVKAAIFQTGVGTQALFKSTDTLGLTAELLDILDKATVVVRGPKPTGALRSRGVRIDRSAGDPHTTREVLAELSSLPLKDERVLVQRYGAKNEGLEDGLKQMGATVIEIPVYRWSLPADTQPMAGLLDALERHEIDCTVFTSASQIQNLFEFAKSVGRDVALTGHLNATKVASIGPVCSAAMARHGVRPSFEASPPKLGPLMQALERELS